MERKKVEVHGFKVMTYTEGQGDEVILAVHGGPGAACNYIRDAHLRYAQDGYRVVSWDQLGCGESDRPEDDSLWTIERFVEEVETVRLALGLGRFHYVGNSWGGILGIEYCLKYQANVRCFVCGNIAPSMPLMQDGFRRVKQNLGEETVYMMALRESEGTTDHPEYQAAQIILMRRHLCRSEVWPEPVVASLSEEGLGARTMTVMFGPHLFNCTGNLRNWDRTDDLHRITIPVLITTSDHDYILPEYVNIMRDYLPDAEYAIFKNCGHLPFWDDPENYHRVVSAFLNKHRK